MDVWGYNHYRVFHHENEFARGKSHVNGIFYVGMTRYKKQCYMITNGADAFAVQRALTHKDIQSTQIYVNLDVEHIREDVNRTVNSMMNLAIQ